jgi:hypothetical protein
MWRDCTINRKGKSMEIRPLRARFEEFFAFASRRSGPKPPRDSRLIARKYLANPKPCVIILSSHLNAYSGRKFPHGRGKF